MDISAGAVVASLVLEEHVYQFVEDGRVVVMKEADDGYQWIEVLTLALSPR